MRELRGEPPERLLQKGWFAERWIFGELTTGVFSNADLVANYEGWRFYQSLFKDNVSDHALYMREYRRKLREKKNENI